jgi:hypothetical protein
MANFVVLLATQTSQRIGPTSIQKTNSKTKSKSAQT